MKTYFDSFSLGALEDEIEEYGKECYNEGYEDGKNDALGDMNKYSKDEGLVLREHRYMGKIVEVWIEGPDFKGDRFSW